MSTVTSWPARAIAAASACTCRPSPPTSTGGYSQDSISTRTRRHGAIRGDRSRGVRRIPTSPARTAITRFLPRPAARRAGPACAAAGGRREAPADMTDARPAEPGVPPVAAVSADTADQPAGRWPAGPVRAVRRPPRPPRPPPTPAARSVRAAAATSRTRAGGRAARPSGKPPAYWPLSIVGLLFSFLFGAIAIYFSVQVGRRWDRGDVAGSRKASRTAPHARHHRDPASVWSPPRSLLATDRI